MKTQNPVTVHILNKNGNTIMVGETGKPNTTKLRDIKIESAQERILNIDPCGDAVFTMEDALKVFRKPAKWVSISGPAKDYRRMLKGSNPAFEYWVDKLKPGEKLPRGKYFKSCEFFR